ncbi:hypothetical protein ACI2TT_14650 [Ralstonia nicotianae]|nr:hypothetical protein G7968_16635 [Ralstonia solanacearum]
MVNDVILMLHPAAGVLAILAAVWVAAEMINVNNGNVSRIRGTSLAVAGLAWLAYLLAGYWYVRYYAADKAWILAGPWPFAHNIVMETKEHVFFPLLMLASYLPIAASNNLIASKGARILVLCSAVLIVLLGLAMEGGGAMISMAAKLGILAK